MHRFEARQIYTTCSGRATSHYPETVLVQAYEPGRRTVEAVSLHGGYGYGVLTIPASYFHETATVYPARGKVEAAPVMPGP